MTNTYLPNCQTTDQGETILSVGFKADGTLANVHYTTESPYTYQMGVDTIHTKSTYDGDNQDVIDFFNREEDHPLYGVLSNGISEKTIYRVQEFIGVINGKFPFAEKEGYPLVKDELLKVAVSTIGLYDDKTVSEVMDIHFDFKSEIVEVSNHHVRLSYVAELVGAGANVIETTVWYPSPSGDWVSNCLTIEPPALRYDNEGETLANNTTIHTSTVVTLPPETDEYYILNRIVTWDGNPEHQPVTLVQTQLHKIINPFTNGE